MIEQPSMEAHVLQGNAIIRPLVSEWSTSPIRYLVGMYATGPL